MINAVGGRIDRRDGTYWESNKEKCQYYARYIVSFVTNYYSLILLQRERERDGEVSFPIKIRIVTQLT
jgi:hypothetical protein